MDVRNGEREALALEANLAAPPREAAAWKMDRAADLAAAPDMAPTKFRGEIVFLFQLRLNPSLHCAAQPALFILFFTFLILDYVL